MNIVEEKIAIRDIVKNYIDETEHEGAIMGYDGRLNIRPSFQRNFVYSTEQSRKVINTILNKFPLNVIYFVTDDDKNYELLDGQQRIISICKFYIGEFSILRGDNIFYFKNLTKEEQETFLDYKLSVYICKNGTDREKLAWFEIINTVGEQLNDQERRNAIYHGNWCNDARVYFSKSNGAAYVKGKDYMSGDPNRQDYLETILKWVSDNNIEQYMAEHQNDEDANELWNFYLTIIDWVQRTYIDYYREMKGLQWGFLYKKYGKNNYNTNKLREEIKKLYEDSYVTDNKGIFEFVLTNKQPEDYRLLNVRVFDEKTKQIAYNNQKGICPICQSAGINKEWKFNEMEADHINAWSKGGTTDLKNCQMLCITHNRAKGNK